MGRRADFPCQKDSIFYAHPQRLCSKHFQGEESMERPKLHEASKNCPRKGRLSGWSYRLTLGQVPWAVLSRGRVGVVAPRFLDHGQHILLGVDALALQQLHQG